MLVLDAGAEDLKVFDEVYEVITEPKDFSAVVKVLEENNIKSLEAAVVMLPQTNVALNEAQYEKMEKFVSLLEDLDDVQNVYHNAEEE